MGLRTNHTIASSIRNYLKQMAQPMTILRSTHSRKKGHLVCKFRP